MYRSALVALSLAVALIGCGDDGSGAGGDGGGGSNPSGTTTSGTTGTGSDATSSGDGTSSASGDGGQGGSSASGDGGAGGSTSSGDGGHPEAVCETCAETERCQECISDDEDEDPYYTCWPSEAPEGEFLCGSTTCIDDGQYCEEDVLLVTSCSDYRCKDLNFECASEDPCDCVDNPCPGIEDVACTVQGGQVFVTCGLF